MVRTFGAVFLATLALSAALHDRPKKNLRKPNNKNDDKPLADPMNGKNANVKTHSNAVSGIHFSRASFMSKDFATGLLKVSNPKQCDGKQDDLGETQCHFHFGEKVKAEISWHRADIKAGTTFELDMSVRNTSGMATMFQPAPFKIKCPICGGICEFDIPQVNGMQLVPTMDDLANLPMGPMAAAMATQNGFPVPQNRSDLSTQVNTMLALAGMLKPELFDEQAFKADDQLFVFGEKTIKFPMPKCPLGQVEIPPLKSPQMNGLSVSLNSESMALSVQIPELDLLDSLEGIGDLSFKVSDSAGVVLAAISGNLGFNTLGKTADELQTDVQLQLQVPAI